MRRAVLPLVFLATLAAPLLAGPPWISIEYPSNPWDPSTRGALLLVHAFHHGIAAQFPVSGTATGMVNGEKRSVPLRFERTQRAGVFALREGVAPRGKWVLVITVSQDPNHESVAQALVEVVDGAVTGVRVPTRETGERGVPRKVTAEEVDAALRRLGA